MTRKVEINTDKEIINSVELVEEEMNENIENIGQSKEIEDVIEDSSNDNNDSLSNIKNDLNNFLDENNNDEQFFNKEDIIDNEILEGFFDEKSLSSNNNSKNNNIQFDLNEFKKERKYLNLFTIESDVDNINLKNIILGNEESDLESLNNNFDDLDVNSYFSNNKKGKKKANKKKK